MWRKQPWRGRRSMLWGRRGDEGRSEVPAALGSLLVGWGAAGTDQTQCQPGLGTVWADQGSEPPGRAFVGRRPRRRRPRVALRGGPPRVAQLGRPPTLETTIHRAASFSSRRSPNHRGRQHQLTDSAAFVVLYDAGPGGGRAVAAGPDRSEPPNAEHGRNPPATTKHPWVPVHTDPQHCVGAPSSTTPERRRQPGTTKIKPAPRVSPTTIPARYPLKLRTLSELF